MKYLSSDQNIMGGDLVIKGTRIPIEVILYRLKDGYSINEIHEMYSWIDKKTLQGAIKEALSQAIDVLTQRYSHASSFESSSTKPPF